MSESTLLIVLALLTIAAIAVVLFDRFAGNILAADPDQETWPTQGAEMNHPDNAEHLQHRNDLHRHFAPGVIEGHKAPMSTRTKVAIVLIYAASAVIVCSLLGWVFGQLMGVMQ
jgi:hypothetical protein